MEIDNLIIYVVITIAALVHGFSGVGFGLVSMIIFSFIFNDIERIAAVVGIIGTLVFTGLFFISKDNKKIDWLKVLIISPGSVLGTYVGYKFLLLFNNNAIFKVFIGIAILILSMISVFKYPVKFISDDKGVLAFFTGIISGIISGVFIAGGPPLALYLYSQVDDPRDVKGTLQVIFIITGLIRVVIVGIGKIGYSKDILFISLIVVLPVIAMLFLGNHISKKSKEEIIRKIIYYFIGFSGLIIALMGALKII